MSDLRKTRFASFSYFTFVRLGGILCIVFLIAPVVVAMLLSFTSAQTLKFPPPGLSMRWYARLMDPVASQQIHIAAGNSVKIAILAVLVRYAGVNIPVVSGNVFETLAIAYIVLLVGNLFRGL